ncbi:unnamed protein product [Closterium sp. NIES-64]|nr:unnamed protein product [Closterium sp. NIES-64]
MYGRNTCSLINPLPVFFPPPPPFNPPAPVPSSSPLSPNLQLPCPHHPHCLRAFKYRDTLVFHVRVDHSGDWGTRGGVAGVSCGEGGSGVGLSNELKAFEAPQKSGEEGSRVGLSDELKGWEKKGKRARRGAVGRNGGKEADFVGGKEGEWGEEREGKRKGEETGEERKGEERNEEGRREEGDEGNWGGNTRDEVEGVTTTLVREASVSFLRILKKHVREASVRREVKQLQAVGNVLRGGRGEEEGGAQSVLGDTGSIRRFVMPILGEGNDGGGRGETEPGASEQVASEQVASEQVASEQVASEQVASKQVASEQGAATQSLPVREGNTGRAAVQLHREGSTGGGGGEGSTGGELIPVNSHALLREELRLAPTLLLAYKQSANRETQAASEAAPLSSSLCLAAALPRL